MADKLIEIKKTLNTESPLRCLAESNRSTWFCRPLPNLPAQAPLLLAKEYLALRVQR